MEVSGARGCGEGARVGGEKAREFVDGFQFHRFRGRNH